MTRSTLFKAFPVLVATILGACSNATGNSNEVDPTNIFGDYTVIQNAKDDSVKVLSWFRYAGQSGTTLRLTVGSEISVNEQQMNLVEGSSQMLNFTGSYYTQTFDLSAPASDYSFVWKRNDGNVFHNAIPAPRKIETALLVDGGSELIRAGQTARISLSNGGFQATYDGSDLQADESIECTLWSKIVGDNQTSEYALSAKWNPVLKNCIFKKEELQRFRLGAAQLELTRKWRQVNKAQGHERAGSYMTSLYIALPVACEILP